MEICSACNQRIGKKINGRPRTVNHDNVVSLYRKGLLVSEIVQEAKCSERSVRRIIKKLEKEPQQSLLLDESIKPTYDYLIKSSMNAEIYSEKLRLKEMQHAFNQVMHASLLFGTADLRVTFKENNEFSYEAVRPQIMPPTPEEIDKMNSIFTEPSEWSRGESKK